MTAGTARGNPERLSSQQVADRLGVRLQTVYAYVSRGLLTSRRAAGGRGSTFDPAQVDALLERDRARRVPGAARVAGTWRGPVVDTDITLIADGHLWFRGVDAVDLAAAWGFEPVAEWRWTGEIGPARFEAPAGPLEAACAAVAALPPSADLAAGLRVAGAAAAAADPLRYDVREHAVLPTARGLVATMVEALPRGGAGADAGPLAHRLWARLTELAPSDRLLGCLDAALVLLIDHDLAVSTVAARTAASVRANPYAVVATGLSALEGPLHGTASALAFSTLREAVDADPRSVVADHLRSGRLLAGFGHRAYPDGDPRAAALLDRLRAEPVAAQALSALDAMSVASGTEPNVDGALAALALAAGMPRSAGEVIFSIARSVGWIAHALEEYDEEPLRFRGEGTYRGPRPVQPVPTADVPLP